MYRGHAILNPLSYVSWKKESGVNLLRPLYLEPPPLAMNI